jgi:hypothetical protein
MVDCSSSLWRTAYVAAIFETEPTKMALRVADARAAITERLNGPIEISGVVWPTGHAFPATCLKRSASDSRTQNGTAVSLPNSKRTIGKKSILLFVCETSFQGISNGGWPRGKNGNVAKYRPSSLAPTVRQLR